MGRKRHETDIKKRRLSAERGDAQFAALKAANKIGNISQTSFESRPYHFGIKEHNGSPRSSKKYKPVNTLRTSNCDASNTLNLLDRPSVKNERPVTPRMTI